MEQKNVVIWAIVAAILVAGALFYFLIPGGQEADNLALRVNDGEQGAEMAAPEEQVPVEEEIVDDEATAEPGVAGAQDNLAETSLGRDTENDETHHAQAVTMTAETGTREILLLAAVAAIGLGACGVWRFASQFS